MATYRVTLDDEQTFDMRYDASKAATIIEVRFPDDIIGWMLSPYQVWEVNGPRTAAERVARYFNADTANSSVVASVEEIP